MTLRVYNTLSRKKEIFETLEPGVVKMYVCGPTVYDKAHVGHAMSVLVFDMIRRYLEYKGYKVHHVMNYTDVDDKIIRRANERGEDPISLAERYIQEFDQHLEDLGVLEPTVKPRVTQEIDWIIKMVKGLEEKGYAYAVDGDVYFRVTKDEDYGKLSGRKLDEMMAGARIDVDERKEHPMDFALWKATKPGEPAWDSPWGKGRPGWHIECSAMNLHHLGEQLDIHGGGTDLIFPHHENEIAQSESYTGKPYVRYWLHNGMLQMAGEKMSKSLGNLVTIEDFLAKHEADVLRMMVLSSHYRSPLTFSTDTITQAEKALERLRGGMRSAHANAPGASQRMIEPLVAQTKTTREGFIAAMDDDFNAAAALGHLFDLVRIINQARDAGATAEQLAPAQQTLQELAGVLGLDLTKRPTKQGYAEASPFIDLLIEIRSDLRKAKQWTLADKIRDRLAEMGVQLEDTPGGTLWRWK